ncbi:MAG: hypothetical protein HY652_02055 [Acidobacteria bacterium]|nr:hypothetical protein [Acidobacteriota bacterium]
MRAKFCHSFGVVCVVFLACLVPLAAYKIRRVEIQDPQAYPSHQVNDRVAVAADPYLTDERSRLAFDVKHMNSRGLLPINVIIDNQTERAVLVNGLRAEILEKRGARHESVSLRDVMTRVFGKDGEMVPVPGPFPGGSRSSRVSREASEDFRSKFLGEKIVAPGARVFGFLFFRILDPRVLQGARIYLPEVRIYPSGEELMFYEFDLTPAWEYYVKGKPGKGN